MGFCIRLVLLALFSLSSHGAFAHPHSWIDLQVDVLFDQEGRAQAIRESWLFDDYYSAAILDANRGTKIEDVAAGIMRNLASYHYFTKLWRDDKVFRLDAPYESETRLEQGRVRLTFAARFESPVDPAKERLAYAVFDPTYFIEILHEEKPDAIRLENAPAACKGRLIAPKPDFRMVALASALDQNEDGGDGLGEFFAEKAEITCFENGR